MVRTPTHRLLPVLPSWRPVTLRNLLTVTITEGRDLAKHLGCRFIETSAKQRINVDEAFSNLVREIRKYNKVRSVLFLWVLFKLKPSFFLSRNNRPDDQPCPTRGRSLQGCTANRVVRMTTLADVVAVVSFFSLGSTSDICREVAFFVMSHFCLVFLDLSPFCCSPFVPVCHHISICFFLSLSPRPARRLKM